MSSHKTDSANPLSGVFKLESISLRTIWLALLGLTALVLVSILVVTLMVDWTRIRQGFAAFKGKPVSPLAERGISYGGRPALQVDEIKDLKTYREAEEKRLTSYGWVDEKAGIAHIPIDVAIKRVMAKGLPARRPTP